MTKKVIRKYYRNGIEYRIKFNKGWKPGANTLGYWPLNNVSQLNDKSGNNDFYMSSSTPPNLDFTNNWAIFSSTYYWQQINSTNQITNTTNNTISFRWCKDTGSGYGGTELDLEAGSYLWGVMSNNTKLAIYRDGTSVYGDTDIINNTQYWYYIVYTVDVTNKIMTLYVNGELYMQTSYSTDYYNSHIYFKGRYGMGLSSVILESKVRTAQEITTYYNNTKSNYGL